MIPSNPTLPFTPSGLDFEFGTSATWAQLYRLRGMQVVPAYRPGEPKHGMSWKRPFLKEWIEYQEALIPDVLFSSWYGPGGQFVSRENMGMITGRASENLFVIDLDLYKTPAAAAWWNGLMMIHNNNMDLTTLEQVTGGGGSQKIYRAPPGWTVPNKAIHNIGVDIKGQGGFVMLPPSMHESGRAYEWVDGQGPDDMPPTLAPDWLLQAVAALVAEHGGNGVTKEGAFQLTSQLSGRMSQPAPQGIYDAFGHQVDGRETYMRDMIWAAVVGYRADAPIPVGGHEKRKVWEDYLGHTRPKSMQDSETVEAALEREGRGYSEFTVKWDRAVSKWWTDVEQAARARPARPESVSRETQGWTNKDIKPPPEGREPPARDRGITPLPIQWLDMSGWDNVPVPTRKWAIRDRVPLNQVGLLSGEGGTGKSIIELMKDVAHVVGGDWLGSMPEQGGAFYLGAEDEAEEIHIRLAAIAGYYKTTFKELTRLGLKVLPLLGQDSMLCVQSGRGNHIETTPLYKQLYEAAGDLKPKNISIDTLSRAFGGDEINRVQVYAFAMHMQAIAKVAQGSVTILSHPSLAGMASGSGISGSTAWHGAFRFRQYLKGVKEEDDGEPDDMRQLEFKKNQYGPNGRPIILRYKDGLFLPVNGTTDPERLAREARLDSFFVRTLRRFCERCDRVTHLSSSPNYYAPKVFAEEPEAKQHGFRKSELEDAMRRLMDIKRVLVEISGKDSRRQSRLCLAPGS